MKLRDIRKVSVRGKRVLVRVDYNVETTAGGHPRDLTRFEATRPTLTWLLQHGARVVLIAHRGRPTKRERVLSLRPFLPTLRRLLRRPVVFLAEPLASRQLRAAVARLKPGQIALLENIRFAPGEEQDRPQTARSLGQLGDVYVNDGFAVSHRAAASVVGITKVLPAYAGLQLQREVEMLTRLLKRPSRPFIAIIGGAKISTKLGIVRKLLRRADHVLLGGALANTVLQAEGLAIGRSLSEPTMLRVSRGLTVKNKHLHIPCDLRVQTGRRTAVRAAGAVGAQERICDIGPDTVNLFSLIIRRARTIVWNGPMGLYEYPPFDRGTKDIARAIARSGAISVVGGGETVDAVRSQGLAKQFTFISTGGGAMLEFLEGKMLPGIQPLLTKSTKKPRRSAWRKSGSRPAIAPRRD